MLKVTKSVSLIVLLSIAGSAAIQAAPREQEWNNEATTRIETIDNQRVLKVEIAGADAETACEFLGAQVKGLTHHVGQMTCSRNDAGKVVLGFYLDRTQTLAALNALRTPDSSGPEMKGAAALETETHFGKTYVRVRVQGFPATQTCAYYGVALYNEKPGFIQNKENVSCLVGAVKTPIAGFIFDENQKLYNLEAFGYN